MSITLTLFELQQDSAVAGIAAEIASTLLIPEQLVLPELQLLGPSQPLRLQCGLVQVQQATNDESIIIQEARDRLRSAEPSRRIGDVKKNIQVGEKWEWGQFSLRIYWKIRVGSKEMGCRGWPSSTCFALPLCLIKQKLVYGRNPKDIGLV